MSRSITLILLAIALLLVAVYRPLFTAAPGAPGSRFNLAELVAATDRGDFVRIEHPYRFDFPTDHGRHESARTETWQVSGVLDDSAGRVYGIQLSIVRIALETPETGWDSGEIYAGQLFVSDPETERLLTAERISRGGIGVADWQAGPLRLWLEDWSIEQRGSRGEAPDLALRFALPGLEFDLALLNRQPLVGLEDVSDTDSERGPPFVYYLQPRLVASGRLQRDGRAIDVSGPLTVEHAWGELPLPGGPLARDRFSLFLEDGRVVLLLRTHRADGSGEPSTVGLVTRAGAAAVALGQNEIELLPIDFRSSATGDASYPVGWRLRLPAEAIDVELVAERGAGESDSWSQSWAGAVRIESRAGTLSGNGFLQLAGYRR